MACSRSGPLVDELSHFRNLGFGDGALSRIRPVLRLAGAQPAVDDEAGPHHEARLVRRKVESGTGDTNGVMIVPGISAFTRTP
jgi:hypothetical protein